MSFQPGATAGASVTDVTLKRATWPIGSANGLNTNGGSFTYVQRMLVLQPLSTRQWRLKVANRNAKDGTFPSQAGTIDTVYVGPPAYAASEQWIGGSASPLALALGATAVTVPATGADAFSGFVTAPALQFAAHVPTVLSMAITIGAGSNTVISDSRAYVVLGNNAVVADVAPAGIGGGPWVYDVRIECDYNAPEQTPVGLFICSSEGSYNPDDGLLPSQAWPNVAGLQNGHPVINNSIGASNLGDWASLAARPWARLDLATYPPDYGVIGATPSNDIVGMVGGDTATAPQIATALASIKSSLSTVVANLVSVGCKRVYLTTVPPRNFNPANSFESLRLQVNSWIRKLPQGAEAIIDMDLALRNSAAYATIDPLLVASDGFHLNQAGSQRSGRETHISTLGKIWGGGAP